MTIKWSGFDSLERIRNMIKLMQIRFDYEMNHKKIYR